jgi:hypothetical protein
MIANPKKITVMDCHADCGLGVEEQQFRYDAYRNLLAHSVYEAVFSGENAFRALMYRRYRTTHAVTLAWKT